MIYTLVSEDDTKRIAELFASEAKIGDCFALYGDLGVGKSTFARFFIQSILGANTEVPSPTFTIMQQYDKSILHVDCYRLDTADDAIEIGLFELLPSSISLIEWPEIIEPMLPYNTTWLYFSHNSKYRSISID